MDRSERRAHESRIKRRVRRYYNWWAGGSERATGKVAQSRKLCSCWACGNPRRHFGTLTRQEVRLVEDINTWED